MRQILCALAISLICSAMLSGGPNLQADIVHNEAVNGDLSSAPAAPTSLTFANGGNTVIGTLSEPASDLRDFMTFTIGSSQSLTGLTLDLYTAIGGGIPSLGFSGINSGATSFIPGTGTAGNFLGLSFVDPVMVGTDMLPLLAAGLDGSIGFTIPLGPGTYTYLIQEITPGQTAAYQMTFNVVPEPSMAGLCCIAGLLISARRRRG